MLPGSTFRDSASILLLSGMMQARSLETRSEKMKVSLTLRSGLGTVHRNLQHHSRPAAPTNKRLTRGVTDDISGHSLLATLALLGREVTVALASAVF